MRQRGSTVSQTRQNKSIPACPHGHKLEPRGSSLTNSSETFQRLPPSLLPRKCPNTKILSGEFTGFKVLTVHGPWTWGNFLTVCDGLALGHSANPLQPLPENLRVPLVGRGLGNSQMPSFKYHLFLPQETPAIILPKSHQRHGRARVAGGKKEPFAYHLLHVEKDIDFQVCSAPSTPDVSPILALEAT